MKSYRVSQYPGESSSALPFGSGGLHSQPRNHAQAAMHLLHHTSGISFADFFHALITEMSCPSMALCSRTVAQLHQMQFQFAKLELLLYTAY